MTKKQSPRTHQRPHADAADPAHAPGKQHLDLESELHEHRPHDVGPATESHRPVSESRVGRGRAPRRG